MRSIFIVLLNIGLALTLLLPAIGQAADLQSDRANSSPASSSPVAGSEKTTDQIAEELTNPLAVFYRLDYQLEYRTYQGSIEGADDQTTFMHLFSPVFPFRQKDGKGWVFRFTLPYYDDQPIYWADRGYAEWRIRLEDPTLNGPGVWAPTHSHTDDVTTDLVYGGVNDDGLILMYGLAGILPTTSDTSNGKQQLILGPQLNIGKVTDWGVYGALMSHYIDVAEKRDKGTPDTNMTTIQAYFSYGLGNGWQLVSNPLIRYDWEGDSGNKLSLPLGGGIAKTMKIGSFPLKVSAEIQKYVVSTDRFDSDWFFKFTLSPVFPTKFTRN
jgi:hypothetical protein